MHDEPKCQFFNLADDDQENPAQQVLAERRHLVSYFDFFLSNSLLNGLDSTDPVLSIAHPSQFVRLFSEISQIIGFAET